MAKKRTFAFIDATNIIYSANRLGWKVDFAKLAKYLRERYSVSKILYYAGTDAKNLKQQHFYKKLKEFGFELRLIPVKTFSDGKKKADVDSRMTFELMLYFEDYDALTVFTGDGDYFWVLEYLKEKKSVRLFGGGKSIARELKQLLGGNVTDIESIKKIISFRDENKFGTDAFEESVPRGYANSITHKLKKSSKKRNGSILTGHKN